MKQDLRFIWKKISQTLWVRPLIYCILSVAGALLAHLADDNSSLSKIVPSIEKSSLEDLLGTIAASMLVIAIFAVGSMLSAFSAASGTATPRSFKLVVADDVSQNALSIFIGSFIYGIVASIALKNGFYGKAGLFTLFVMTLVVFALVIITFLRWVQRISKLGRLSHTIEKVEAATIEAFKERLQNPFMGGCAIKERKEEGHPLYAESIGYVQHIKMKKLQELAEEYHLVICLNCLPESFISPLRPVAFMFTEKNSDVEIDKQKFLKAFIIEKTRSFQNDPRFGLIALSEIASRALSPAINDPGTAIAILGSHVRLFCYWLNESKNIEKDKSDYTRIEVPALSLHDMFEDAFRPIARDGAGNVEVMIRFQKSLSIIANQGSSLAKELASIHASQAIERAALEIKFPGDLEAIRKVYEA